MEEKLTPAQARVLEQISPGIVSKSMTTGYNHGGTDQFNGQALRRQSLANDLKNLTYGNSNFTLFTDIGRRQADSTVEEYTVRTERGQSGHSAFTSELDIAVVSTPTLERRVLRMKYISSTKQASIASGLVNNTVDPMTELTEDAMVTNAQTIEQAMFYGDSNLSAQGAGLGLEFDGLANLIDKENILDARGEALSETLLNKASTVVTRGFGSATDAYMPIGVYAEFMNSQLGRQRIIQATDVGKSGVRLSQFVSASGNINLHGSVVMDRDQILREQAVQNVNAPAQPKVAVAVADGKGTFRTEDIATHTYKVVTRSTGGESIPSEAITAVVAKEASEVTLTITPQALYQAQPSHVVIYRKGLNGENFYKIGTVPFSELKAGVLKFVDTNSVIPETSSIFVGELKDSTISLYELLSMTRVDLARINASTTFTVLWYGALALFAPKRWVQVKNVKTNVL